MKTFRYMERFTEQTASTVMKTSLELNAKISPSVYSVPSICLPALDKKDKRLSKELWCLAISEMI